MSAGLTEFRSLINRRIARGEIILPVTDVQGGRPVVFALDDEPLFAVLGRLRAIGGYANLFVRGKNRIRQVSLIDQRSAIPRPDVDMTADDLPDPTAPVGMFLDYLECHPNGVLLPVLDPVNPAVAKEVQFA